MGCSLIIESMSSALDSDRFVCQTETEPEPAGAIIISPKSELTTSVRTGVVAAQPASGSTALARPSAEPQPTVWLASLVAMAAHMFDWMRRAAATLLLGADCCNSTTV